MKSGHRVSIPSFIYCISFVIWKYFMTQYDHNMPYYCIIAHAAEGFNIFSGFSPITSMKSDKETRQFLSRNRRVVYYGQLSTPSAQRHPPQKSAE